MDRLKRRLVGRWLITYFIDSPGPHYAPAIAFNAFVAIFPIILGAVSLLLLLNPNSTMAQQVETIIRDIFPLGTRTEIQNMFKELNRHPGTVALIATLAMAWAGTAMFASLGAALNAMHGTSGRNLLHQRLMGLRLLVVLAVALVIMVLAADVAGRLPLPRVFELVVAGLVLVMLLAFIYRVAPNIHRSPRDVIPGAIIAAVLVELATLTFPLFRRVTDEASTYGQGLAVPLLLLFWLYLVSHFILLGAHFNDTRWEMRAARAAEDARRAGEPARPESADGERELVSGVKY